MEAFTINNEALLIACHNWELNSSSTRVLLIRVTKNVADDNHYNPLFASKIHVLALCFILVFFVASKLKLDGYKDKKRHSLILV